MTKTTENLVLPTFQNLTRLMNMQYNCKFECLKMLMNDRKWCYDNICHENPADLVSKLVPVTLQFILESPIAS